ncbi:hypothetical protein [Streptomyces atriruber]|uniref:hypothetical protein n=1 Tax=Streptomyces atriruber TaxID=545121 RepID=UPI0006E35070|nr:hypothetical protein [Streptomyces atriruber]
MTEPKAPADDGLADALKRAAASGGLLASPVPAHQVSARGARRRRRTHALGAALAVVLVSGGTAFAALQIGRGSDPVGPAAPPSPTKSASVPGSSLSGRSSSPTVTPSRTPPSLAPSTSLPPTAPTPPTATASGG